LNYKFKIIKRSRSGSLKKIQIKIIILLIFGIFFVFSHITTTNSSFNKVNCNKSTQNEDDSNLDNYKLKISAISGKIHINGNSGWIAAKVAGICTGNGTYSEPYIIEDLEIDGGGSGSCMLIENSDVYFKIENCTVYNSGIYWDDGGIKLSNVNNGELFNNSAISCGNRGLLIYSCSNNNISENTVNNNLWGINVRDSGNIIISGNSANYNYYDGIWLLGSNNNVISGNTANYNNYTGIVLEDSIFNNVSGNTVSNNNYNTWSIGIELVDSSNDNIVSGNIVNNNRLRGISVGDSERNTIIGNTINDNSYGINLDYSNYNSIRFNIIEENDIGIYLKFSNNNEISDNIFNGNTVDFQEYVEPKFTFYELVTIGIIISTVLFSGMYYTTIFITRKRTAKDEKLKKIRIAGLIIHIVSLIIIFTSLWYWNETAGSLASISAGIGLTIGIILLIVGLVSLVLSTQHKKIDKQEGI